MNPEIKKYNFQFGNATDVGRKRKVNEDYFANFDTKNGYVFVVCDGMGGHAGGEKASRIAVKAIKKYLIDNISHDPSHLLINSIYYANEEIINYTLHYPEFKGMGTTCIILLQKDSKYYYAHVGDSRLYYYSGNEIIRLTKDHSFVQSLIDMGSLSEKNAANHPRKNEITNALGIENMKLPTVCKIPLQPNNGDCLILCTDGLYGMVSEDLMKKVLYSNKTLTEQADELVLLANNAGGFDNITLQIVKVCHNQETINSNIWHFFSKKIYIIIVLVFIFISMVIGFYFNYNSIVHINWQSVIIHLKKT